MGRGAESAGGLWGQYWRGNPPRLDTSARWACWLIGQLEPCVFGVCLWLRWNVYFLWVDSTFMNQVSPSWSVRCCGFPRCDVDVEVLQVGFEGVCLALTLASYFPASTTEFTVQQLLGYPGVWLQDDWYYWVQRSSLYVGSRYHHWVQLSSQ